jgi:hypothetical protein
MVLCHPISVVCIPKLKRGREWVAFVGITACNPLGVCACFTPQHLTVVGGSKLQCNTQCLLPALVTDSLPVSTSHCQQDRPCTLNCRVWKTAHNSVRVAEHTIPLSANMTVPKLGTGQKLGQNILPF